MSYRIPASVISRAVGDEEVLLDLERQVYYGLSPVGAAVWRLLRDAAPFERVLRAVIEEFEVEPDRARGDIRALLLQLERKGLLRGAP